MNIARNEFYRHKESGRIYQVIAISNESANKSGWPVTVVYRDEYQATWSRPLSEFKEKYVEL